MAYSLIKWVHVLSAIAALGANLTYSVWISRAAGAPQSLVYTLQSIRYIDNRLANRAYILLLLTGLIMVYMGRWMLTTSWLITALVLYVIVALLGAFVYSRTLRSQIELAETTGPGTEEYQALARRSNLYGAITIGIVVIIVFLMVVKPHLFG
jgi:uncharacterized membrane protein